MNECVKCLRPYHVENTGSRPITEVKQRRARLVLGWVTAWEYLCAVDFFFFFFFFFFSFFLALLCFLSFCGQFLSLSSPFYLPIFVFSVLFLPFRLVFGCCSISVY